MMKLFQSMSDFTRTMLLMPRPWVAWLGLLVGANLAGSLIFIGTLEARIVLVAFLIGAMLQTWIFSARGFVRLLGIGHILWIPMVPWLWIRLEHAASGSPLKYWLMAVIILDSLSLIIDAVDVVRYIRGERTPRSFPTRSRVSGRA